MVNDLSFIELCVKDTTSGLKKGLNQFSAQGKAAVIYAVNKTDQLKIFDPDGLLSEHALKLKDFYDNHSHVDSCACQINQTDLYSKIVFEKTLRLDGLFCNGGSSSTVFHQMWFTTRPPDICSPAPFISWLTYAAIRFSHDIANSRQLYTGVSGKFLREYANYAIHNTLLEKYKKQEGRLSDTHLHDILEAILEISRTHEEGKLPYGKLLFTDTETIEKITFNARFTREDLPRITGYKHVRKLLQSVENTSYRLISDGTSIIGISNHLIPGISITADYEGKHGFLLFKMSPLPVFLTESFFHQRTKQNWWKLKKYSLTTDLSQQKERNYSTLSQSWFTMPKKKILAARFSLISAKKIFK